MSERDLIGIWQEVAYGDEPTNGLHLLHLRSDGTAATEGELDGKRYSTAYSWRLTGPATWELRRPIPLGEIPELEEETVEVREHTVVAFDGIRMSVTQYDYEEPFHYERQLEPDVAAE